MEDRQGSVKYVNVNATLFPHVDFYNLDREGGSGTPYNGQHCEVYKNVGIS